MSGARLLCGDVRAVLATLPDGSVQTCVTSPPYYGLRDYGVDGQLGLEATPDAYVAAMVEVFRAVRRVLADDGTLWLNLGDSYGATGGDPYSGFNARYFGKDWSGKQDQANGAFPASADRETGLRPKNLLGIPWRVAFALQADGWYLRSDIIWAKPNPMPESVTDRPTKAHEYVFLLSKAERYYYDAAAIAEPFADERMGNPGGGGNYVRRVGATGFRNDSDSLGAGVWNEDGARTTRNARTVWPIATQPYTGAHFATMPEELARRCILAGSRPGDAVLDPFGGSGTTAAVAVGHGRRAVHIDLNPEYIQLARERIGPMLCEEAA
jgi:DNA modification methylase